MSDARIPRLFVLVDEFQPTMLPPNEDVLVRVGIHNRPFPELRELLRQAKQAHRLHFLALDPSFDELTRAMAIRSGAQLDFVELRAIAKSRRAWRLRLFTETFGMEATESECRFFDPLLRLSHSAVATSRGESPLKVVDLFGGAPRLAERALEGIDLVRFGLEDDLPRSIEWPEVGDALILFSYTNTMHVEADSLGDAIGSSAAAMIRKLEAGVVSFPNTLASARVLRIVSAAGADVGVSAL